MSVDKYHSIITFAPNAGYYLYIFFLGGSLRGGHNLFQSTIFGLGKGDMPCRGQKDLLRLTCLWQIVYTK